MKVLVVIGYWKSVRCVISNALNMHLLEVKACVKGTILFSRGVPGIRFLTTDCGVKLHFLF